MIPARKSQIGGKIGKEEKFTNKVEFINENPGPGAYEANKSTVILNNNMGNSLKSKAFE